MMYSHGWLLCSVNRQWCMIIGSGRPSRGAEELSSFLWKTAVFNSKFLSFYVIKSHKTDMELKLWYSSSFLWCLFILWNYDVFVTCYWFKAVSEVFCRVAADASDRASYRNTVPSAKLKALGLAFAYRNRTYIIREREISAFEWSKFQSDWHNGWETDLEEKRAKFSSPNSRRQLWTNVYQITSFEKTDFPAFEWNQFQIHTTNIWDSLLGNVSRTDRRMCEISTSDAIMVAIEGAADLPQTSNSIRSPIGE